MLTQEKLFELFDVNIYDGKLYWCQSRGRVARGQEAGTVTQLGYCQIRIDGKFYRRSRLIWLAATGEWPKQEIDHINRDKLDDSIDNLRDVSRAENARNVDLQSNNTSGFAGIRFRANRWEVSEDKQYIGRFRTLQDAVAARR